MTTPSTAISSPTTGSLASVIRPYGSRGLYTILLYSMDADGNILERIDALNNSWSAPEPIGAKAKPGTSITAVHTGNVIRLFYVGGDDRCYEVCKIQTGKWEDRGAL